MDLKPRIQLRIVSNNRPEVNSNDPTTPESTLDSDLKQKKRGRPRKQEEHNSNPDEAIIEVRKNPSDVEAPKKRGRKKKPDLGLSTTNNLSSGNSDLSVVVKNYIVELKVKSQDLQTIQKRFIHKTQEIGYTPLQFTQTQEAEVNHEEYFKLLNNLEIPLTQVNDLGKINMVYGQSFKNQLPQIPDIYETSVIPILPNRIPIRLFDEFPDLDHNGCQVDSDNNYGANHHKSFRNTSNLVLPQLSNQGNIWPQSSPYPCWNCDVYFDGTPIGIIDKEVNGKFHCYGNCCDFSCAARYLSDRESTIDFWNKYSLLCILYQKVYGLSPDTKVPIAPPRETLIKYGGKLSYEEYHNDKIHTRKVEIYKLPLVPVMLHIDELIRSTNINSIIEKNQNKTQDSYNANQSKKSTRFIAIDPAKMKKAEENIKLKSQERIQSNLTLDDCFSK